MKCIIKMKHDNQNIELVDESSVDLSQFVRITLEQFSVIGDHSIDLCLNISCLGEDCSNISVTLLQLLQLTVTR